MCEVCQIVVRVVELIGDFHEGDKMKDETDLLSQPFAQPTHVYWVKKYSEY